MKFNKVTILLIVAAAAGLGIVAYEQGKAQQTAADSGVLQSIQNYVKSLF